MSVYFIDLKHLFQGMRTTETVELETVTALLTVNVNEAELLIAIQDLGTQRI